MICERMCPLRDIASALSYEEHGCPKICNAASAVRLIVSLDGRPI
jgi:hypothetical protein